MPRTSTRAAGSPRRPRRRRSIGVLSPDLEDDVALDRRVDYPGGHPFAPLTHEAQGPHPALSAAGIGPAAAPAHDRLDVHVGFRRRRAVCVTVGLPYPGLGIHEAIYGSCRVIRTQTIRLFVSRVGAFADSCSADPRQRVADQHVDDASAADT